MASARSRKPKVTEEPVLEHQAEEKLVRDVQAVMRRYRQRKASFEESEGERDRVIRSVMAAGLPRARLAELTDLSVPRLDQIRAGRR